jgi:hypothetical protein
MLSMKNADENKWTKIFAMLLKVDGKLWENKSGKSCCIIKLLELMGEKTFLASWWSKKDYHCFIAVAFIISFKGELF